MKYRLFSYSSVLILMAIIAIPGNLSARNQSDSKLGSVEQKALQLLEETLIDAKSLKLDENQIYFEAIAATALWKHDEKRARAMIAQISKRLGQVIRVDDPTPLRSAVWLRANIRREIAQTLAALNAELAREFIAATRPEKDPKNEYSDPDISSPAVALNQPQDAKQLFQAIESRLAQGIENNYFPLLKRLQKADPAAAARAVRLLIDKMLAEETANKFVESTRLYPQVLYLLNQEMELDEYRAKTSAILKQATTKSSSTNSVLGENGRRELLAILARTALKIAPKIYADQPEEFYQARQLLTDLFVYQPEIKKYLPVMAEKLQPLFTELQSALPAHSRGEMEFRYLRRYGSLGEMIEAIRKSKLPFLDHYCYFIARRLMVEGGDFQTLRQLINEMIPERGKQQSVIDNVLSNTAYSIAEYGRFDLATQLLNQISSDVTRAASIINLASRLLDNGERDNAAKLIEKAADLLSLPVESSQQVQTINSLMHFNSRFDPARNFAWLEGLNSQLIELAQAYTLLGEWDSYNHLYAKDSEIGLGGYSAQYLTMPLKHLSSLARVDFERAKSIAESFTQIEVRLFAQLMVARGVLNPEIGVTR